MGGMVELEADNLKADQVDLSIGIQSNDANGNVSGVGYTQK